MPFGNPYTDIEGHIFQTPFQGTDKIGSLVPVCSGQGHGKIPLVPEGAGVGIEANAVEFAVVFEGT